MPRKIARPPTAKAKLGAGHQRKVVHAADAGVAKNQVIRDVKPQCKPRTKEILQPKAERHIERGLADSLAELVVEPKRRKAEPPEQIGPPAGVAQRVID